MLSLYEGGGKTPTVTIIIKQGENISKKSNCFQTIISRGTSSSYSYGYTRS